MIKQNSLKISIVDMVWPAVEADSQSKESRSRVTPHP
jgi:hypothetical protein